MNIQTKKYERIVAESIGLHNNGDVGKAGSLLHEAFVGMCREIMKKSIMEDDASLEKATAEIDSDMGRDFEDEIDGGVEGEVPTTKEEAISDIENAVDALKSLTSDEEYKSAEEMPLEVKESVSKLISKVKFLKENFYMGEEDEEEVGSEEMTEPTSEVETETELLDKIDSAVEEIKVASDEGMTIDQDTLSELETAVDELKAAEGITEPTETPTDDLELDSEEKDEEITEDGEEEVESEEDLTPVETPVETEEKVEVSSDTFQDLENTMDDLVAKFDELAAEMGVETKDEEEVEDTEEESDVEDEESYPSNEEAPKAFESVKKTGKKLEEKKPSKKIEEKGKKVEEKKSSKKLDEDYKNVSVDTSEKAGGQTKSPAPTGKNNGGLNRSAGEPKVVKTGTETEKGSSKPSVNVENPKNLGSKQYKEVRSVYKNN